MPDWPHAPVHRLDRVGAYIVTGGTVNKQHHFRSRDRLELLQQTLWRLTKEFAWELHSWAIFSNHYHFVAGSPDDPQSLRTMLARFHQETSSIVNEKDGAIGRNVWFQYWDTQLTHERSYLARLRYVNENPVRHGLVPRAANYPWCSAGWFEREMPQPLVKTVASFKIDRVNVYDPFNPVKEDEQRDEET